MRSLPVERRSTFYKIACPLFCCGSQALFWKVNTWGEEAFLDKLIEVIEKVRDDAQAEVIMIPLGEPAP